MVESTAAARETRCWKRQEFYVLIQRQQQETASEGSREEALFHTGELAHRRMSDHEATLTVAYFFNKAS